MAMSIGCQMLAMPWFMGPPGTVGSVGRRRGGAARASLAVPGRMSMVRMASSGA